MKLLRLMVWGILSGLLLGYSWPFIGFPALIFVAWMPLLLAEHLIVLYYNKPSFRKAFIISYPAFVLWNLLDTWWIKNAEHDVAAGYIIMLLANLANAGLMASVFSLAHKIRHRFPPPGNIWLFPVFWISFEFLHHDWDLTWPWLTLGNAFATLTEWVQWYEYTGVFGGSLWVWAVNILFFRWTQARLAGQKKELIRNMLSIVAVLTIPVLLSLSILKTYKSKGEKIEVVVVQPNIDPFFDKFDRVSAETQIEEFNQLALSNISDSTLLIMGPETALPRSIDEAELSSHPHIKKLDTLLRRAPQASILTGLLSHRFFYKGEKMPEIAKSIDEQNTVFYVSYNSALFLNVNQPPAIYHKSKLVPGVEQMPFPSIFKFVENWAIDLGGTSGTLGKQSERTIFNAANGTLKIAPSVCYESIYSEFMRKYVLNGANLVGVITNDGWWGDTPGYKQHQHYARLRAIELRRSVIRSANTGISCVIDPLGNVNNSTKWWTKDVFKANVELNNELTFFVRYGGVIAYAAVVLSIIVLLYSLYIFIQRKLSSSK